MKIVIAGAGEVGTHLAKLLSQEEQDISLLDKDAQRLASLDASYNLLTTVGNPISFDAQASAGSPECDLFIAVTPYETENVVACQIAKNLGAKKTVARIDNYEFMLTNHQPFFRATGVDTTIYPEYLAALEIRSALERSWARHWFELHQGQIIVVGVKLHEGAPICGMQLKEFAMKEHNFHVSMIRRHHDIIIPRGDDHLLTNDIIYFTTTREHIDTLCSLCGKRQEKLTKLMLTGASRIIYRLYDLLEHSDYTFKIIDNDREHCHVVAGRCPNAEVINGDARDVDLLREEGINDIDAFIALNESSETNILACLTAKEMGVKKTIAEVENIQFISEAENLNIGTVINKKLLASSDIFQMLLDSDQSDSRCLALADAEVAEIEARPGSKITKGPVRTLTLSRDMTIAGLIRDGKGMLVGGNTVIMPGDHVVIFCLQGSLHRVERLFT